LCACSSLVDGELLERREEALAALLTAALWDRFGERDDESIGVEFTADGRFVFRAPDSRPKVSLAALLSVPR